MVFQMLAIATTILIALAWAGDVTALSFTTFNFIGVTTNVRDQQFQLDGSITVGTPFSGSYTFDAHAPDAVPASTNMSAFQSRASDGYGLVLDIGNYHLKTPQSGVLFITVQVDAVGTDSYRFLSSVMQQGAPPLEQSPLVMAIGELVGPSPIFTSDALPLSPPSLTSFTSRRFDFLAFNCDTCGEIVGFDVTGELTSLTPIPEPTTLLLWGTTAAGVGLAAQWRQRRRKQ